MKREFYFYDGINFFLLLDEIFFLLMGFLRLFGKLCFLCIVLFFGSWCFCCLRYLEKFISNEDFLIKEGYIWK